MNADNLLDTIGEAKDQYILSAVESRKRQPVKQRSFQKPLLVAAVVAMTLVLVGCGVVCAQGWFADFFARKSEAPLTRGQVDYIAQNEQIISESQTRDEWTVELRSAINDGTKAYVILGVTGPAGANLEDTVEDGQLKEIVWAGNGGLYGAEKGVTPEVTAPKGVNVLAGGHFEEDGDGLSNTKNYVIEIEPIMEWCRMDPFGPDAEYKIHIENIIRHSDDEEYKQELLNGKYAGQTDVMFEPEEVRRMWKREILAEGVWDFTVTFARSQDGMELLREPIYTMAYAYREGEPLNAFLHDTVVSHEKVKITSFVLSPLSAVITYECDAGCNFTDLDKEHIYAVMKDGSQIELVDHGGGGANTKTLNPASPIVLGEADHILMPDGTHIPMG